jgi:hypothetical protein
MGKLIHEKNLKSKSRGTVPLCVAELEEIGFVKILFFYMKHLQILDDFLSLCIYSIFDRVQTRKSRSEYCVNNHLFISRKLINNTFGTLTMCAVRAGIY